MEPDDDGLLHICTASPSTKPDGTPLDFLPEWRTEAVLGLAEGILADGAYNRLPILADALEEAGCDLPAVLLHCREPIAHESGCWVLRMVTGRDRPPDLTEQVRQLLADAMELQRQVDVEAERLAANRRQLNDIVRRISRLERGNRWRRLGRWMFFGLCALIGLVIGQFVAYLIAG